jgi:hypothetical protein
MTKRWAFVALLIGTLLRLMWVADMEWKYDETWMFEKALAIARGADSLPSLGMMSGAGMVNPGFSIWPFALFARLSPSPIGVVRWVQMLNVVALWGFFIFALRTIPEAGRRAWLGGLSLFAVSPLPVLFSRKVWAQDILPIFCLGIWVGHLHRRRYWGAFAWGLLAPIAGQVHMSGFFLSLGLFLATLVHHYRARTLREVSWAGWFSGSLVALVPMLAWVRHMLSGARGGGHGYNFPEVFTFKFFTQWFGNAWGVNLKYSAKGAFLEFARMPVLGGVPTWGVGLLHIFLLGTGVFLTGRWLWRRERLELDSHTRFYLVVAGLVVGGLLQGSGLSVHAHYQIILAPFIHIWAAALLQSRPRLFAAVFAAQLTLTGAFLVTVHELGGFPAGSDYGRTYGTQNYSLPSPSKF